jgi:hypothetical protein
MSLKAGLTILDIEQYIKQNISAAIAYKNKTRETNKNYWIGVREILEDMQRQLFCEDK